MNWQGSILSQSGGYFLNQKHHNSAYWLQWFTIPFLHRPQCKETSSSERTEQSGGPTLEVPGKQIDSKCIFIYDTKLQGKGVSTYTSRL